MAFFCRSYEKEHMYELRKLVRTGNASKVLEVGDQINVKWTDRAANQEYVVPLDIVHFGEATLRDGEAVPAMYTRQQYRKKTHKKERELWQRKKLQQQSSL